MRVCAHAGSVNRLSLSKQSVAVHVSRQPPVHSASKNVTAGLGVVEGDEILYRPEARDKRQENFANRVTRDAESKCYARAWKMRMVPHREPNFQLLDYDCYACEWEKYYPYPGL